MIAVYIFTLFCLVSVSQPAPLACEYFIQPLDQLDPHHLEGRWVFVADSLSNPAHLEDFKQTAPADGTSNITYTPSVDAGGKCHYQSYNVSLEGSILTFNEQDQLNLTVTFLYTSCPDCVVMRFDTKSKELQRLLLFSRRREVEQEEKKEFQAQVECLKMPAPVVMDPTKDLCTEQSD
ncbi:hypothetical protein L3Q82_005416 [Scomber scombrus]|uniref:Apolipoprotein M n=1 Tax=Scomber scombrus TaxID=13677 RepID=A0AAV1N490_SCOSC